MREGNQHLIRVDRHTRYGAFGDNLIKVLSPNCPSSNFAFLIGTANSCPKCIKNIQKSIGLLAMGFAAWSYPHVVLVALPQYFFGKNKFKTCCASPWSLAYGCLAHRRTRRRSRRHGMSNNRHCGPHPLVPWFEKYRYSEEAKVEPPYQAQ